MTSSVFDGLTLCVIDAPSTHSPAIKFLLSEAIFPSDVAPT